MKKTKIDWCDSTWNPVTGCYHECPYCYARRTANRFSGHGERWNDNKIHVLNERVYAEEAEKAEPYPYGFVPTIHRYRLNEYEKKKGRTIFVCSQSGQSITRPAPALCFLPKWHNSKPYILFFNRFGCKKVHFGISL